MFNERVMAEALANVSFLVEGHPERYARPDHVKNWSRNAAAEVAVAFAIDFGEIPLSERDQETTFYRIKLDELLG